MRNICLLFLICLLGLEVLGQVYVVQDYYPRDYPVNGEPFLLQQMEDGSYLMGVRYHCYLPDGTIMHHGCPHGTDLVKLDQDLNIIWSFRTPIGNSFSAYKNEDNTYTLFGVVDRSSLWTYKYEYVVIHLSETGGWLSDKVIKHRDSPLSIGSIVQENNQFLVKVLDPDVVDEVYFYKVYNNGEVFETITVPSPTLRAGGLVKKGAGYNLYLKNDSLTIFALDAAFNFVDTVVISNPLNSGADFSYHILKNGDYLFYKRGDDVLSVSRLDSIGVIKWQNSYSLSLFYYARQFEEKDNGNLLFGSSILRDSNYTEVGFLQLSGLGDSLRMETLSTNYYLTPASFLVNQDSKLLILAQKNRWPDFYNWGPITPIIFEQRDTCGYSIGFPLIVGCMDIDRDTCSSLGNEATINAGVSGGVLPYSYNWGAGWTDEPVLQDLAPGFYDFSVTDSQNCFASVDSIEVDCVCPIVIYNGQATSSPCDSAMGGIKIHVQNSSDSLQFDWLPNVSSSDTAGQLLPGVYFITVTDLLLGCSKTIEAKVYEKKPNYLNLSYINYCSDGYSTMNMTTIDSIYFPLTLEWEGEETGAIFYPSDTSLNFNFYNHGLYTVNLHLSNGCIITDDIFTAPLMIEVEAPNITCPELGCGYALAEVSNGWGMISWNNGEIGDYVSCLWPGQHEVSVTNNYGCEASTTFTIEVDTIALDLSVIDTIIINEDTLYNIIASPTVGFINSNDIYQWNSGQTGTRLDSIESGFYSVTLTSHEGCVASNNIRLGTYPSVDTFRFDMRVDEIFSLCPSLDDLPNQTGNISLVYAYPLDTSNWLGITGNCMSFSSQSAGTIQALISGCENGLCDSTYYILTIHSCDTFGLNHIINPPSCWPLSNGSIELIPHGGSPPYSFNRLGSNYNYTIYEEHDTLYIPGLNCNEYDYILRDKYGCEIELNIQMECERIDSFNIIVDTADFCLPTGSLNVIPLEGVAPYSYYFDWNNNGGSLLDSIKAGTYKFRVIDSLGCRSDILYFDLPQTDTPEININYSVINVCGGLDTLLFFSDYTSPGDFTWMFIDTTYEDSIIKRLSPGGNESVLLQIQTSEGCLLNASEVISEWDTMTLDFSANLLIPCLPAVVQFQDTSFSSKGIMSKEWTVNGTTYNSDSPIVNFAEAGLYDVQLIITDSVGCSDTLLKSNFIEIYNAVSAGFEVDINEGCAPMNVQFQDTSSSGNGISSWEWLIDGNVYNEQNPDVYFGNGGVLDVQLSVTDSVGCVDTVVVFDYIKIGDISAGFSGTPLTGCDPLYVQLQDTSSSEMGLASWEWNVDTITSYEQNPNVIVQNIGEFDVQLIVSDSLGCLDTLVISQYINVADSNCVWPGDTDTSNVVDNNDILNIGIGYGTSGPLRPAATLGWYGQNAPDWSQSTPATDVNYKHIDCDGNGIINADDTTAIILNWGQTHTRNWPGNPGGASGSDVLFYVEPDTAQEGQTVSTPLILGDSLDPAVDVYGLAFTLQFPPEYLVEGTIHVDFTNSWLGDINSNMIAIQKEFYPMGQLKVGVTRIDGMNVNGLGQVGEIIYTLQDDIIFRSDSLIFEMDLNEVKIISVEEIPIGVRPKGGKVTVFDSPATSVEEVWKKDIQIFPNPTSEKLMVQSSGIKIKNIEIINIVGEEVYNGAEGEIDVSKMVNGTYLVKIETPLGILIERVVIMR